MEEQTTGAAGIRFRQAEQMRVLSQTTKAV